MKWHDGWPYQPNLCPCDDDFLDYMSGKGITEKLIFHMGPGMHHEVGLASAARGNAVFSVTISPEEADKAKDYLNNGTASLFYRVQLGDLHLTDARLIPDGFDFVNLFHLLEEIPPDYARSGPEVIQMMFKKLKFGGRIVLYEGSYGINRAKEALQNCLELEFEERYKSLLFYKRGLYRGRD